jgi:hypothetical protein
MAVAVRLPGGRHLGKSLRYPRHSAPRRFVKRRALPRLPLRRRRRSGFLCATLIVQEAAMTLFRLLAVALAPIVLLASAAGAQMAVSAIRTPDKQP